MVTILQGDCLDILKTMPESSVDSIVTDPPYGLSFMGKKWDYDVPSVAIWAECLRVLKPGGHLLAFSGTRTQHRMCCRIEDAGFEIRDMIAWVYGSGFPKSLDVSKAIDKAACAEREVIEQVRVKGGGMEHVNRTNAATHDYRPDGYQKGENVLDITAPSTDAAKQWDGWGTALKPALEPITVARKPFDTTVAENVQAFGTGALNIAGCRIETDVPRPKREVHALRDDVDYAPNSLAGRVDGSLASSKAIGETTLGRWPANFIHDGSQEVIKLFPDTPAARGVKTFGVGRGDGNSKLNCYGDMYRTKVWEGVSDDGGSAARFFYCAKANKRDRGEGNTHPTVKPTKLMRYLCRLVTPPNGTVLDPFNGSGSTGKGAVLEDFSYIGIEREAEHVKTSIARIEYAVDQRKREIEEDRINSSQLTLSI